MSTVIKVENLSKIYRLGQLNSRTLSEDINRRLAKIFKRPDSYLKIGQELQIGGSDRLWALENVSFEVNQGEVLGVIGRNGAGKSTLLKILSRVTAPTTGTVKLKGRIASLLEVGTGFHPELTGRENIFLNGAILGMKRQEINRDFDEIVTFSEVEQFIDTPVKRYSSGMYVRLAFAVAAYLDPEILIVDEVLAVGDFEFQKKCLGKMKEVAAQGRTVLFVSHNMGAIQRLCNTGLLLNHGQVEAKGEISQVVKRYLSNSHSGTYCWSRSAQPSRDVFFTKAYLCDINYRPISVVASGDQLGIVLEYRQEIYPSGLQLGLSVLDDNNDFLFSTSPVDFDVDLPTKSGIYKAIIFFPPEIFMPRSYGIKAVLWRPKSGVIDSFDNLHFSVIETQSLANKNPGGRLGRLAIKCEWEINSLPEQILSS